MLLITGTFRVSPDKLEEARPAMRRMIEGSRAEDGCITYGYADDILEPGLIHVTELWTDRAALEKHFTAPHLAEWRKAGRELGLHDGKLQICDPVTLSPL